MFRDVLHGRCWQPVVKVRRKKGTASRFPHSTGIGKKKFGERKSVAVPHFRPKTLLPRAARRERLWVLDRGFGLAFGIKGELSESQPDRRI